MASFFNVGGNPFATPIGQKIEQATDCTLASENWAVNMEICDMINESSDVARDAMKAIRKRLAQNAGKNPQVIMYTLTVLETCVKNCGKAFHVLVANKEFIQELVKIIGPKNDPPAIVQEKVLNLIQIWADAFKNQPDLSGVNEVYMELKNKGIEFPQTDLDTMAPIYTPQRSVPEMIPQQIINQPISPQNHGIVQLNSPTALTQKQITKLQGDLEIVEFSMSILSEMLNELKPGEEDPEDYALLTYLTETCKEMQGRIVELIGRINNDEITATLLRLNDELNNLFLRHQRYEKNRSTKSGSSPSAILAAAIGTPTEMSAAAKDPQKDALIDLSDMPSGIDLTDQFSKFDIGGPNPKSSKIDAAVSGKKSGADEFDMLAQSRNLNSETSNKSTLMKDIPLAETGSANKKLLESVVSKVPSKDSEFDEMEAWLSHSKAEDGHEEAITSTEFDKFLEERAAAAENLPSVTGGENIDSNEQKKSSKKEDLLSL